jgi:protein-L-isoaspartate(D-aspartate) O-methyltransferase
MPFDEYQAERMQMVEEQIAARGILTPEVLDAFRIVPRHDFIPAGLLDWAYADSALSIGAGQTISQPYIVALMTDWLWRSGAHEKILEIGTGSGYQAAILAELGMTVYSLDILPDLTLRAQAAVNRLGYGDRIFIKTGDGFSGWPEAAPFDAALITCAVNQIPDALTRQLKPGGRVLAPLGKNLTYQTLTLATLTPEQTWITQDLLGVVFVPMTGKHGFQSTD